VKAELQKLGKEPKPKRDPLVKRGRPRKPVAEPQEPGYYGSLMHIKDIRKRDDRPATWFDVRDAYIAGYRAGELAGSTASRRCPVQESK
jgi:hypothetical protein